MSNNKRVKHTFEAMHKKNSFTKESDDDDVVELLSDDDDENLTKTSLQDVSYTRMTSRVSSGLSLRDPKLIKLREIQPNADTESPLVKKLKQKLLHNSFGAKSTRNEDKENKYSSKSTRLSATNHLNETNNVDQQQNEQQESSADLLSDLNEIYIQNMDVLLDTCLLETNYNLDNASLNFDILDEIIGEKVAFPALECIEQPQAVDLNNNAIRSSESASSLIAKLQEENATLKKQLEEQQRMFELNKISNHKLIEEIRASYEIKVNEIISEQSRSRGFLVAEYEHRVTETKLKTWVI